MAKASVLNRGDQYQLPASVRDALIGQSSQNPNASISQGALRHIEQQRQRFIAQHGDDGLARITPE